MKHAPDQQLFARISLSIDEAVKATGLSRGYIYKLLSEGLLTRRKVGKRTFIMCDELKEFMLSRPTGKWRRG